MCVPPARPAGVDEPSSGAVLLHLLGQHGGVLGGVKHDESRPKACREGGLRLFDAVLGAGHLFSEHYRSGHEPWNHFARNWTRVEGGQGEEPTSAV